MNSYWININSFEVFAEDQESAGRVAELRIKEDPSLAQDFEVILNEENVDDEDD